MASGNIGAVVVPLKPKQYRLDVAAAEEATFDALRDEMGAFVEKLRQYPPPKSNGKYIRTNTLYGSWDVSYRRGIYIELYNTARYAQYVYGDNKGEGQQGPPWLAPGWPNMYLEFTKAKVKFVAHAQKNFSAWVKRMGY